MKLVIKIGSKEYELDNGGSQPGPNSVNSETIEDGSVQMEDLKDNVKEKIKKTYVEDDEALIMDYDIQNSTAEGDASGDGADLNDLLDGGASTAESGHSGPIIVEEEEEP